MDDGKCHICRRVPLRQSNLYSITTCVCCAETADAQPPGLWSRFRAWFAWRKVRDAGVWVYFENDVTGARKAKALDE